MKILSLKNVKYQVNTENILNNINLDIQKGDCVSVVGVSGSGKSTLLKLCADLISVTGGDILYNEKKYSEYEPMLLRREISYCVQIPYLFGDTVYDNLSYPFQIRKENVDKGKIIKILNQLNLDESYLYKDINSLSGGERQRVALARNLMFIPEILLLDEVTSGLDIKNAKVVENLIEDMNKGGVTVIWITHSAEQSTSIFNRRIHIEKGKVIKEEELI